MNDTTMRSEATDTNAMPPSQAECARAARGSSPDRRVVAAIERERLDTTRLSRRWGRHPVSIDRYVDQKILAPPHRFLGRKMWFLDQVEEAERRLGERERARRRKTPPEKAVAFAASGRAAKELNRQLRAAAAETLAVGGVALVARALAPFSSNGRLDAIEKGRKADAAWALRKAAAEVQLADPASS